MAQGYDGRAIAHPVFVKDGVVVSGNNRSMSGLLAAERGTGTKCSEALAEEAGKMGFTPEQIAQFNNPRAFVEISDELPLNTEKPLLCSISAKQRKTPTEMDIVAIGGRGMSMDSMTHVPGGI